MKNNYSPDHDTRRLNFWEDQARELDWASGWSRILDWRPPFAKWFVGGRLNVAYNCVDRHLAAGLGERVAIYWEGEPGDSREITYDELQSEVNRAANALTELGVKVGDRVAIYLPMIPEAVFSMLACARVGAPHTVVFGGFSAESLRARIEDVGAKVVITADGGYRRGQPSALKPAVDKALEELPSVDHVLVVRRTGQPVGWVEGRDVWWHDLVGRQSSEHTAQPFDAEHPLFILYTSGTTAKPKGILHTTGGYLTQVAYTQKTVFDLRPEEDVYWCTADVGWITGHSYVVYGPLANGATQVIYEGAPDSPTKGRWWEIIQKYGATILYTSPTAIRTFMKWGEQTPADYDLSSLRLLGSVGEPINPEAWLWYRKNIGGNKTPIVDTWWQTETGAIAISPLPGEKAKPGAAMGALPGMAAGIVDKYGKPAANGDSGYIVLTKPWPSMLRGIWGDPERYKETYWSRFGTETYFPGDGAKRDEDGDIWILGRIDDTMNVSGHLLSTAEIESALVGHAHVAEAAVVGASDETTGQRIVAFVILMDDVDTGDPEALTNELKQHVAKIISPIAKPKQIVIVPELPKTRSGKIMRRLLRDAIEDYEIGDTTTLSDSSVMSVIIECLDTTRKSS
jgi:acetyl-CoA synthetase